MKSSFSRQRGYTLIELMAASAIFATVSVLMYKFILGGSYNLTHVGNQTDLIRIAQRVRQNIHQTMQSSQMLMAESVTAGTSLSAYRTLIANSIANSSTAPPPVAISTYPVMTDTSQVNGSAAMAQYWGNQLMLACVITPVKITITVQAGVIMPVSVDRYQFVSMYLAKQPNVGVANFGSPAPLYGAMGLVQWRSQPYLSYGEIVNLGNKLTQTCIALVAAGYTYAWEVGVTYTAQSFHAITGAAPWLGVGTQPGAAAYLGQYSWAWMTDYDFAQRINIDPLKPQGRIISGERFGQSNLYSSRYSVAYNTRTPTAANVSVNSLYGDYGINMTVPLFATPLASGFPGGFEVLINGSSGSRQAYIRCVYMASSGTELTYKSYRSTVLEDTTYIVNPF